MSTVTHLWWDDECWNLSPEHGQLMRVTDAGYLVWDVEGMQQTESLHRPNQNDLSYIDNLVLLHHDGEDGSDEESDWITNADDDDDDDDDSECIENEDDDDDDDDDSECIENEDDDDDDDDDSECIDNEDDDDDDDDGNSECIENEDDNDDDDGDSECIENEDDDDDDDDDTELSYDSLDSDDGWSTNDCGMDDDEDDTALEAVSTGLSWRMDSRNTFSDWTVEIKKADGDNDVYHVHRNVLAVGSKKSEYFQTLFLGENFKESSEKRSVIELNDHNLVEAFPVLMDYMYSSPDFNITDHNVCQLRSLAQYFIVPALMKHTINFIKVDMDNIDRMTHYVVYYRNNSTEGNLPMLAHAASKCAKNVCDIAIKSPLLDVLPVGLFYWIAYWGVAMTPREHKDRNQKAQHVTRLIVEYASRHVGLFSGEFFVMCLFTNSVYDKSLQCSVTDFDTAFSILELVKNAKWDQEWGEEYWPYKSLLSRCVSVMVEHYIDKNFDPTSDVLTKIPHKASFLLLETIITEARKWKTQQE